MTYIGLLRKPCLHSKELGGVFPRKRSSLLLLVACALGIGLAYSLSSYFGIMRIANLKRLEIMSNSMLPTLREVTHLINER
jgi:hypothetical protein